MHRRTITLGLIVAALAAPLPVAGQGPQPPAGCYRVHERSGFFSWATYESWSSTYAEYSSDLIELTSTPHEVKGAFQLRLPGMRDGVALRQHAASSWSRVAPDSVALEWTNRESGLRLRLRVRGDSLVGTFTSFTDMYMEGEFDVRPVTLHKLPCPTAPSGGGTT